MQRLLLLDFTQTQYQTVSKKTTTLHSDVHG